MVRPLVNGFVRDPLPPQPHMFQTEAVNALFLHHCLSQRVLKNHQKICRPLSIHAALDSKPSYMKKLYIHKEMEIFFSSCVDDLKMVVKKENVDRVWKNFIEIKDLEGLAPLLDQIYLGCTQHEAKVDPETLRMKSDLFRGTPTTRTSELRLVIDSQTEAGQITSWGYDMQGHTEKCVDKLFELTGTISKN